MTEELDPLQPGAIGSAVGWVEGTLLGTVATTVAVIAVATVGFLMLTGRIDIRRATQVVLGCFILIGASTIASGIFGAVSGTGAYSMVQHAFAHSLGAVRAVLGG